MKLKKSFEERLDEIYKNLKRFKDCKKHEAKYITRWHGDHWWMEVKPCSNCEPKEYEEYLKKSDLEH